jgi:hypothetical protein
MGIIHDLTGKKFGLLTAVSIHETTGHIKWNCVCECGGTRVARRGDLTTGKTKSCGCIKGQARVIDRTGQKYGKLVVICRVPNKEGINMTRWLCICECKKETVVNGNDLKNGHTQSCGCLLNHENRSKRSYKHGHSHRSAEYNCWANLISRCTNHKNIGFENYGGRGITVCDRWLNSFEDFLNDMGTRPSDKHSIDRIDVNGDYEPSNCTWSTREVQARNTRIPKNNNSGYRGVKWDKDRGKWLASINVNRKRIFLGLFKDLEEAARVRIQAEEEYWGMKSS